jgi:hypothetical protein
MTPVETISLILPLVVIAGALGFAFGWAARGRSQPKIARRRRFAASVEGAWRDVDRAFAEDHKSLEKDVDALRRDSRRLSKSK